MAHSNSEIKMNSTESSDIDKNIRAIPRAISRNSVPRAIESEQKIVENQLPVVDQSASRREFFKTIVPATGKLLTSFLRSVESTITDIKERQK